MTISIITHVSHGRENGNYFAYGPYVREMNIWTKFVDKVIIVAPLKHRAEAAIDLQYDHKNITFKAVPEFDVLHFRSALRSMIHLPSIIVSIFNAMRKSDHIHLRCPGNMGLLGCLVQVLFPHKPKTAKYAGNWDPKAVQPISYRFQKWLLNNSFLTRNIQVLVYGEWPNTGQNSKAFFTASYSESDKTATVPRLISQPIQFLFVGTLSEGKQPMYAIKLAEKLRDSGIGTTLHFFGEGNCRQELSEYVAQKQLNGIVSLMGNQSPDMIRAAYQKSHFLLLPSKSEGWPKAVAEAMFWGCVPASLPVSCIAQMLQNGNRGIVLTNDLATDSQQFQKLICDQQLYSETARRAMDWSRQFTLELFEQEIGKLLK